MGGKYTGRLGVLWCVGCRRLKVSRASHTPCRVQPHHYQQHSHHHHVTSCLPRSRQRHLQTPPWKPYEYKHRLHCKSQTQWGKKYSESFSDSKTQVRRLKFSVTLSCLYSRTFSERRGEASVSGCGGEEEGLGGRCSAPSHSLPHL